MSKLINWVEKPKEEYADVTSPKSFPERLRKIRKSKNLTQGQLAEKSGIGKCLICLYEKGKTTPSILSIEWLCGALGVSASELLGF